MALGDYISGEPGSVTNKKSPIQKVNEGIQSMFAPVAENVTGPIAAGIGKTLGNVIQPSRASDWEKGFRSAGEATPRMVTDALLTGATGRFAPLAKAVGYADVAGKAYAEAPEDASIGQKLGGAALQAGAWKYAPEIGGGIGGRLTEQIAGKPTAGLLSKIVHRGGSALGTLGAFEAANTASSAVTGADYNPFTVEHAAGALAMVGAGELAHLTAPMLADKLAKTKAEEATILTHQRDTEPIQSSRMWTSDQLQKNTPWGMTATEALNDPQGYGLSPDKEGYHTASQLGGRLKTILPPAEWDVYEKAGMPQWLQGKSKVHTDELRKWVTENSPKVEVRTIESSAENTQELERVGELRHELDTQFPDWDHDPEAYGSNDEFHTLMNEYEGLQRTGRESFDPNEYKYITPHNGESTLLLVRLPTMRGEPPKFKGRHFGPEDKNVLASVRGYWTELNGKKVFHVFEVQSDWGQKRREVEAEVKNTPEGRLRENAIARTHNIANDPLLRDYNRLALQSALDYAVRNGADGVAVSDAETAMMTEGHDLTAANPADNPLPFNEGMAREMVERGLIDQEQVDDARRMGEFTFDTNLGAEGQIYRDLAKKYGMPDWGYKLKQEGGMRLNYDPSAQIVDKEGKPLTPNRFPTAEDAHTFAQNRTAGLGLRKDQYEVVRGQLHEVMEKQTGVKGEMVILGEHAKAFTGSRPEERLLPNGQPDTQGVYAWDDYKQRDNLIFKNPDGTPKTSITANLYDLSKFKQTLAERGGIPLFGGGRYVIDPVTKKMLLSWDEDGVDPVVIKTAAEQIAILKEQLDAKDRAKATMLDIYSKLVGVDPKVNLPNDPNTLLASWKQYLEFRFKKVMGLPDDVVNDKIRQGLKVAAMVGHSLGETRVLPAVGTSFFEPSRGNVPNALIGLAPIEGHIPSDVFFRELHQFVHEALHNIGDQVEGKTFGSATPEMIQSYKDAFAEAYKMTRKEMWDHLTVVAKGMLPPGFRDVFDNREQAYMDEGVYKTQDQIAKEFLSDLGSLVTIGAASPKSSRAFKTAEDLFRFAGDHLGFVKGFIRDFAQILDALKDFAGRMLGWNPKTLDAIDNIHQNIKKLLVSSEKSDAAVEMFLRHYEAREARPWAPIDHLDVKRIDRLNNLLGNSSWDPELKDFVLETSSMIVPQTKDDGLGKRLSVLDRLKAIPQLVRDFPEFLATGRLGRAYFGMVSNATMQMWDSAKDPLTGKADYAGFGKLKASGPTGTAFGDVVRKQNEGDGRLLTEQEKAAVPSYVTLSNEDKAFVNTKLTQSSSIVQQAAWMLSRMMRNSVAYKIGPVLMSHDNTMTSDQAKGLSHALINAYLEPDLMDPMTGSEDAIQKSQEAQRLLQFYPNQDLLTKGREIVEAATPSFLKAREKFLGKWDTTQRTFEMRPGWMPEMRIGRYQVEWTDADGKTQYEAYKTKSEYTKRYQELQAKGAKDLQGADREDRADAFKGLRPDAFAAFVDVEKKALDAAMVRVNLQVPGSDETLKELQKEYALGEASALLTSSPMMGDRKLLGGREKLNMAEGLIHYIDSVAYTTAKAEAKGQRRLILNDPQLKANPNLQKNAREYLSEILDPKGKEFTLLKNLVFFNYMGLKPSQFFVEMTQQFATHVPALINQGMGIGDAYGAAVSALKDSAEAVLKGRASKSGQSEYSNPVETRAVKEAIEKHVVSAGWLQELFHLQEDLPFANARNEFTGNAKVLTREGLIGKPLYQVLKLARNFYSLSTRWNTEAAFLSSFRFFHNKLSKEGLDGEKLYSEAFKQADDLTQESMFGGGKASRPLFFLTGKLGATVGGLMYMLQSYTYNAIAQQARYLKNSIAGTKLTPQERVAASKAAGAAIVTQVCLAGVMGIPFSAQAFALVEQMFPNSEPRRRMRELFQVGGEHLNRQMNLFSNDQDMGHFVSDAAMDGLLNQGPVDLSSRFQLGGLLGVDPYRGFSWGNVVGPSADMLESWFVKAPQALSSGQPGEAAKQLLPTSLKTIADLSMNGFALRNKDERLNVQLTDADKMLLSLGFKPKRVAQFQNLNDMQQRAEKVATLDQRQFHGKMADLLEKGDVQTVRTELLARAQTVPNYDVRQGAQRIAELVQGRQIPYDPARDAGRVGATYNAAKLFPPTEHPVSELQRTMEKHQLVQSLGFRSQTTKAEVRQAQLVDQLMGSYPGMSRAEALAMIERMTGAVVKKEFGF